MISRMIPPSTETGMSVFCRKGMNRLRMLAISMLASSVAKTIINVQILSSEKLMPVPPQMNDREHDAYFVSALRGCR